MKFDVSSTALSSRLQVASKVIAAKNSLPILDNFLFSLEGDMLTITAADSETRLVTTVQVMNAQGSGVFALSAKNILDLKENAISMTMDSKTLLSGISRSLFATADDELRPVMNGVYFDIQPDNLTFVASDGRKLIRLRNFSVKSEQRAAFILPKKPANLLKNILSKDEGVTMIKFDENNAHFISDSFEMVCRLIEGRYPNYNSVIPQENPYKVTIDRVSFLTALKRVSVFSQSSSLIKLQLKTNELTIFGQDIDFSIAAEEHIPCQYNSPELSIGFNSTYLIEILSNISSESIVFELADPSRAGVIVPEVNEENEDLLTLLMPMMLND